MDRNTHARNKDPHEDAVITHTLRSNRKSGNAPENSRSRSRQSTFPGNFDLRSDLISMIVDRISPATFFAFSINALTSWNCNDHGLSHPVSRSLDLTQSHRNYRDIRFDIARSPEISFDASFNREDFKRNSTVLSNFTRRKNEEVSA